MTDCEPTVYGPCADYATLEDVRGLCDTGTLDLAEADPDADPPVEKGADVELVERMLHYASRRTFLATGGRFWGCCAATVRPPGWCCCVCGCVPGETWCGCTTYPMLALPSLPVRSIDEVVVDGTILDPSEYALIDHAWLALLNGDRFPPCQQLELPTTEAGTWSYTVHHGLDLPPEGVPLVAQYGVELAKNCRGFACGLGPGIRVVHRDGVDFEIIDPATGPGGTGFGPLDDWIAALNGGHVTTPPRLYRPGRQYGRATLVDTVVAS